MPLPPTLGVGGQPKSHPPAKFWGAVVRPKPVPPGLGGDTSPNPGPGRGYLPKSQPCSTLGRVLQPLTGLWGSSTTCPPHCEGSASGRSPQPHFTGSFSPTPRRAMAGWQDPAGGTQDPPPPISLPLLILGKQQKGKKKIANFRKLLIFRPLMLILGCGGVQASSALQWGPRGRTPVTAPPTWVAQPPPSSIFKKSSCHDYAEPLSPALGAAGKDRGPRSPPFLGLPFRG